MKLKVNLSLLVFLITMGLALLSCGTEANYPEVPIYEEEEEEEEEEEVLRTSLYNHWELSYSLS